MQLYYHMAARALGIDHILPSQAVKDLSGIDFYSWRIIAAVETGVKVSKEIYRIMQCLRTSFDDKACW